MFGALLFALLAWVVPRFEGVLQDFKVSLAAPTKTLLSISHSSVLLFLLAPLALIHAFAAAAWYPRSSRLGRFLYRVVLILLLGAVCVFLFIALFLPYVTLMNGISGAGAGAGPGGSKR